MAARSSSESPPAGVPSLVPQGPHAGKPPLPITRPFTLVGSRSRAHFHLLSKTVSKSHAAIILNDDGVYIRDLASREHVIVNGKKIKEAVLAHGDYVAIGSFMFQFSFRGGKSLAQRLAPQGELHIAGVSIPFTFDDRTVLIGRRPTCDIHLLEPEVSTCHALCFEINGDRYIRDLGSRTGTLVNGKPIHHQPLEFGDTIVVGDTSMRYEPLSSDEHLDELEDLVGTAQLSDDAELSDLVGLSEPELLRPSRPAAPVPRVKPAPRPRPAPLEPARAAEAPIPLVPAAEAPKPLPQGPAPQALPAAAAWAGDADDGLIPLAPIEDSPHEPIPLAAAAEDAVAEALPIEADLVPLDSGLEMEPQTKDDTARLPIGLELGEGRPNVPRVSDDVVDLGGEAPEIAAEATADYADTVELAQDEQAGGFMVDGESRHDRLSGSGSFADLGFDGDDEDAAKVVLDATERALHHPQEMGLELPAEDLAAEAPAEAAATDRSDDTLVLPPVSSSVTSSEPGEADAAVPFEGARVGNVTSAEQVDLIPIADADLPRLGGEGEIPGVGAAAEGSEIAQAEPSPLPSTGIPREGGELQPLIGDSAREIAGDMGEDAGPATEQAGPVAEVATSFSEDAQGVEELAGSRVDDAGSGEEHAEAVVADAGSVEEHTEAVAEEASSVAEDAGTLAGHAESRAEALEPVAEHAESVPLVAQDEAPQDGAPAAIVTELATEAPLAEPAAGADSAILPGIDPSENASSNPVAGIEPVQDVEPVEGVAAAEEVVGTEGEGHLFSQPGETREQPPTLDALEPEFNFVEASSEPAHEPLPDQEIEPAAAHAPGEFAIFPGPVGAESNAGAEAERAVHESVTPTSSQMPDSFPVSLDEVDLSGLNSVVEAATPASPDAEIEPVESTTTSETEQLLRLPEAASGVTDASLEAPLIDPAAAGFTWVASVGNVETRASFSEVEQESSIDLALPQPAAEKPGAEPPAPALESAGQIVEAHPAEAGAAAHELADEAANSRAAMEESPEIIGATEPTPESAQPLAAEIAPETSPAADALDEAALTDSTFGRAVEAFSDSESDPVVEAAEPGHASVNGQADEPVEAVARHEAPAGQDAAPSVEITGGMIDFVDELPPQGRVSTEADHATPIEFGEPLPLVTEQMPLPAMDVFDLEPRELAPDSSPAGVAAAAPLHQPEEQPQEDERSPEPPPVVASDVLPTDAAQELFLSDDAAADLLSDGPDPGPEPVMFAEDEPAVSVSEDVPPVNPQAAPLHPPAAPVVESGEMVPGTEPVTDMAGAAAGAGAGASAAAAGSIIAGAGASASKKKFSFWPFGRKKPASDAAAAVEEPAEPAASPGLPKTHLSESHPDKPTVDTVEVESGGATTAFIHTNTTEQPELEIPPAGRSAGNELGDFLDVIEPAAIAASPGPAAADHEHEPKMDSEGADPIDLDHLTDTTFAGAPDDLAFADPAPPPQTSPVSGGEDNWGIDAPASLLPSSDDDFLSEEIAAAVLASDDALAAPLTFGEEIGVVSEDMVGAVTTESTLDIEPPLLLEDSVEAPPPVGPSISSTAVSALDLTSASTEPGPVGTATSTTAWPAEDDVPAPPARSSDSEARLEPGPPAAPADPLSGPAGPANPFLGMSRDLGSYLGGMPINLAAPAAPLARPFAEVAPSLPGHASAGRVQMGATQPVVPDVVVTEPLDEGDSSITFTDDSEETIADFLAKLEATESKPELFESTPESLDDLPDSMGPIGDVVEVLGEAPLRPAERRPAGKGFDARAGAGAGTRKPVLGPMPPRPRLGQRSLTASPFAFGSQPASDLAIPPFKENSTPAGQITTAFDGLAMPPVRETDVFSQPPAAPPSVSSLGAAGGAAGLMALAATPSAPVNKRFRADAEIPRRPRGVGAPALETPAAPVIVSEAAEPEQIEPVVRQARPGDPSPKFASRFTGASSPPPRRKMHLGIVLPLILLLAAGSGAGIWFCYHASGTVQGHLRFGNLDKMNIADRKNFELSERMVLRRPDVRDFARRLYEARLDSKVGEGFLYTSTAADNRVFDQLVDGLAIPQNSSQILMSLTSRDPVGDGRRLASLIQALYRENQHYADDAASARQAYEQAREGADVAAAELTRLTSAVTQEQKDASRLAAAQQQLEGSKAKSAALWQAWDEAARRLHDAQAEVDRLEVAGTPSGARAPGDAGGGSPAKPVDSDAQVKDLSAQLAMLTATLSQARVRHSAAADTANKALDQALAQFNEQIGAARGSLKDGSQLSSYLTAAQQAQDTIRQLNADLVERQKAEQQRLGDLRRVLAEKQEARLKAAWAADAQLQAMEQDLSVAEHRFNAAVGSGLDTDAAQLKTEVESLKKRIDARRDLIGTGDIYADEVKSLQQFIDDSLKGMEADRVRADTRMGEMLKALASAAPQIEKLPADQQALAEALEKQLAGINDARRLQAEAVAAANPDADAAVKKIEASVTEIQAKLDARRKQLADESHKALTAQQEQARAAALERARTALSAAQKAEAEASTAERANKVQTDAAYSLVEGLKASESKLKADTARVAQLTVDLPQLKTETDRLFEEWQRIPIPEAPQEENVIAASINDPRLLYIAISTLGYTLLAAVLLAMWRSSHHPHASAVSTRASGSLVESSGSPVHTDVLEGRGSTSQPQLSEGGEAITV